MIYEENQEVISWGIKEEDLSRNNPPVWGNYGTNENPDWYLETNSTDHFFLLMAVHNGTLGGLTYNANYFGQLPPNVMHFIQQTWCFVPEISNDKQKVYTDNFFDIISISLDENNNGDALFVGTSNQERFDYILDTINVDWSYVSYEDEECEEAEDDY